MYTLTIIRLRASTREFQNTENHHVISDGQTILSILAGINADETFAYIQRSLDAITGSTYSTAKVIELRNEKLDCMWFCYISKTK